MSSITADFWVMLVSCLVILDKDQTRRCFYFHQKLDLMSQTAQRHQITETSASYFQFVIAEKVMPSNQNFNICIYHKNKKTKTTCLRLDVSPFVCLNVP